MALATAEHRPGADTVRRVWKKRHGLASAPLLLLVAYPSDNPTGIVACGALGDSPPLVHLDPDHATRIAAAALAEPDRHAAHALVARALDTDNHPIPGLINRGLLATHELVHGVPQRDDWHRATNEAQQLLALQDHDLIRGLGFELEHRGRYTILRTTDGQARAVAVFLHAGELPDLPSRRHDNQTPMTFALTHAERDNLPWVVSVSGSTLRLYSTSTSAAVGQRGRTETFVELDLPLLRPEQAGYLDLLFSARGLADGGPLAEIQHDSQRFTSDLSERLRERVYQRWTRWDGQRLRSAKWSLLA